MSAKEDRIHLTYILECIANVDELTASGREAFEAAKHDRAAVLYYLQTMAESTQRLSETIKASHAEIDWLAIAGFRNRLVHGYLNVNVDILWSVIENYLPGLKLSVGQMLAGLNDSEAG
jgi:uncharacterized protein with HEPN domain